MFAVMKTGGKQYKVAKGDIVIIEKLEAEEEKKAEEKKKEEEEKKEEVGPNPADAAVKAAEAEFDHEKEL